MRCMSRRMSAFGVAMWELRGLLEQSQCVLDKLPREYESAVKRGKVRTAP